MIKMVRKYHDKDEYDVAHESGRVIMYDADRLPKTAVRFMESAGDVRHRDDEFLGNITEYRV